MIDNNVVCGEIFFIAYIVPRVLTGLALCTHSDTIFRKADLSEYVTIVCYLTIAVLLELSHLHFIWPPGLQAHKDQQCCLFIW